MMLHYSNDIVLLEEKEQYAELTHDCIIIRT